MVVQQDFCYKELQSVGSSLIRAHFHLNPHIPSEAQRWLALVTCGLPVLWFPHDLVENKQVYGDDSDC